MRGPIRAPRGTERSCRGWVQEAALRMLFNNLDPEVAECPEDLVVYGGNGKAARDWASFDRIVSALRSLGDDETLLVQSGKPVGIARTHVDAPRVLLANSNLVGKWANLRLMFTYMFMHPGAKLLFMGNEFAATKEWNYTTELQWDLLKIESHAGMRKTVQALNEIYKNNPALYELQFDPTGFEWVEINKREEAVIAFKRKGLKPENDILVVMNMTPVPRHQFPIHVAGKIVWNEIFNSDAKKYGGTGDLTNTSILVHPQDEKGEWSQVLLNLPALSAIVLV